MICSTVSTGAHKQGSHLQERFEQTFSGFYFITVHVSKWEIREQFLWAFDIYKGNKAIIKLKFSCFQHFRLSLHTAWQQAPENRVAKSDLKSIQNLCAAGITPSMLFMLKQQEHQFSTRTLDHSNSPKKISTKQFSSQNLRSAQTKGVCRNILK